MSRRPVNKAAARVLDGFFSSVSAIGRALPGAGLARHGVECVADISYGPLGQDNFLDLYRPSAASGPMPVVLYIHGGGFRALSKESHWLMGLVFARRGYLVVNINYRLGPQYPYPAALQDACAAWLWALQNVGEYGGDPGRMVIAGESAGANLAMALSVACCYPRPEPWAQAVFDAGVVPSAIAPVCGLFQVSDVERYRRAGHTDPVSQAILDDCRDCYLPNVPQQVDPALADPVCIIEAEAPGRPLPPAFLAVGGWDPLRHDNRRMAEALAARGGEVMERTYPRQLHAFHAFVFRTQARKCWQEMLDFVGARVEVSPRC